MTVCSFTLQPVSLKSEHLKEVTACIVCSQKIFSMQAQTAQNSLSNNNIPNRLPTTLCTLTCISVLQPTALINMGMQGNTATDYQA